MEGEWEVSLFQGSWYFQEVQVVVLGASDTPGPSYFGGTGNTPPVSPSQGFPGGMVVQEVHLLMQWRWWWSY